MRAHTITTAARVGARVGTKGTIVPGGILAVGLAVVLLGATASSASATTTLSTTSAPPPPLTLSLGAKARIHNGALRGLAFEATTNHASRLAVTGRKIEKTMQDLEGGGRETAGAELKHPLHRDKVKVKIKATATDEFGQAATDQIKYVLRKWCGEGQKRDPHYGTRPACGGR